MGRRGSRRPMSVGFPARLVSGRVDVDLRRSEDRGRMVVAVVAPAAPTRVWASRTLMGRRGSRRPMSVGFPARLVSGRVDVDLRRSEDPRVAKHRRQAH